jgi:hypothetical protein
MKRAPEALVGMKKMVIIGVADLESWSDEFTDRGISFL